MPVINLVVMYHLDDVEKQTENNIIDQILQNNQYDSQPRQTPRKPKTHPEPSNPTQNGLASPTSVKRPDT
jgi:hypothetical protein